jgi:hypothetical protein
VNQYRLLSYCYISTFTKYYALALWLYYEIEEENSNFIRYLWLLYLQSVVFVAFYIQKYLRWG